MARPSRIDCSREDAAIEEAKRQCGIDDVDFNGINLYCYNIMLPLAVGDEKAAEYYEIAEKEGWTTFSMKNDWKTIYGDGVTKTALPGAETALQDAA